MTESHVALKGSSLTSAGWATAHSHAFQRALRARTQRRANIPGSFWSWRGLMYAFAEQMTPEEIYDLSAFAFAELALSGISAVGEFHYVHHQANGQPYDNRTELSEQVIRAARDVGLRISLLRVVYERAGQDQPPEGAQRRFSDSRVDDALRDVTELRARYKDDPCVTIGLAPHSVRAVTLPSLLAARDYAETHKIPLHMHVSEQREELRRCLSEHGRRPVELLHEHGLLSARFTAVHATHLTVPEAQMLGSTKSFVCVCRTTERDLGDGLMNATALHDAGARLCVGVDSHALSDPFEEARAIELDERLRAEQRQVLGEAPLLLQAATAHGYSSIGMAGVHSEDELTLDIRHPCFAGIDEHVSEDMLAFAAQAGAVRSVKVGGEAIVSDGQLTRVGMDERRQAFDKAVRRITTA